MILIAAATTIFGLEIAEWGLVALAVAFVFEVAGVSRSSRTIRRQNADLRERNAQLEGEVKALQEKTVSLERQIEDLKLRSVDALMTIMRDHDDRMSSAASQLGATLDRVAATIAGHEERATVRHQEMVKALNSIANSA